MRYREYQVAELFRLLGKQDTLFLYLLHSGFWENSYSFLLIYFFFGLFSSANHDSICQLILLFTHIFNLFIELFTLQPPLSEDFYWTLDDAAVQVVGNYCIWYTLFSPLLLIPSSEPCSGSPLLYMRARPDIHCQRWVVDGEGKETSHAGLSWGWLRQVSPKKRTMIG